MSMTEKQREFRDNLVRYLRNTRREADLEDILAIFHLTYLLTKPSQSVRSASGILRHFEELGIVDCRWVRREGDFVVERVQLKD